MSVVRCADPVSFAATAAAVIAGQLTRKPDSAIALPTGNTPIGLYAELVRQSRERALDFKHAQVFNLDEYVGLNRRDPRSYGAFIDRHVVAPLRLCAPQVRLLCGDAADLEHECLAYDAALAACGGLDLCVLGLGINGHIAFNEPGTPWDSSTHVVCLSSETRATHAAQCADGWRVPVWGMTMGIRSILDARAILLLIAGTGKAAATAAFYRGKVDEQCPVTCLTTHANLTVIELCGPAERR